MGHPTATWDRRGWLSLLAVAPSDRLAALASDIVDARPHDTLRAPETGTVMTRGRMGGTGAPFNLGEVTVTRCSVRLADGTIGHGTVQGRDKGKARRVALLDALMQTDAAAMLAESVLAPLAEARKADRAARAAKAAATKVDFLTLVRGED